MHQGRTDLFWGSLDDGCTCCVPTWLAHGYVLCITPKLEDMIYREFIALTHFSSLRLRGLFFSFSNKKK